MGRPPLTPVEYQLEDMRIRSSDLYALTKYRILLDWLSPHPNLRILNVGCGSGELSFLLAAAGHKVVGIDPVEKFIALANRRARELGLPQCTFQVASLESHDGEGGFDAVVATDIIEHIQDDRSFVSRMVSLLKPGGFLVVTVPQGQWLFGYHEIMWGHYRRYSFGALRSLLGEFVRIRDMRSFGFFLIPVCILFSVLLRRSYPVAAVGDGKRSPILSRLLEALMAVEKRCRLPLGTSLLAFGQKE